MWSQIAGQEKSTSYVTIAKAVAEVFFGLCVLAILPPPFLQFVAKAAWQGGLVVFVLLLLLAPLRKVVSSLNIPFMVTGNGAIANALVGALYFFIFAMMVLLIHNTVNDRLYSVDFGSFAGNVYEKSQKKAGIEKRVATATLPSQKTDGPADSDSINDNPAIKVIVTEVLSGDSFKTSIDGAATTVRLIGVAAPAQGKPMAKEAKDLLVRLIDKKTVDISADQQDHSDDGRLLRYVYSDEMFVNSEIIRLGLARFEPYPGNEEYDYLLRELENQAKKRGLGMWSVKKSSPDPGLTAKDKLDTNTAEKPQIF